MGVTADSASLALFETGTRPHDAGDLLEPTIGHLRDPGCSQLLIKTGFRAAARRAPSAQPAVAQPGGVGRSSSISVALVVAPGAGISNAAWPGWRRFVGLLISHVLCVVWDTSRQMKEPGSQTEPLAKLSLCNQ